MLPSLRRSPPTTAALLCAITACSSSSPTPPTEPPTSITRLSILTDTVRLRAGATFRLNVRALDAAGSPVSNATLAFGVRHGVVASVAADGAITGLRLGTTSLRVSAGDATADVPVVVSFDSTAYVRRSLTGGPFGIALAGDALVVTQKDAGSVAVGSIKAHTVAGGIPVGHIPTDVSVNAAGTDAYVTNQYSNSLGILDLAARQQVAEVALPHGPYRSVLSRDGKRVWVTTNAGPVYAVDVASRRVVDSLPGVGPTNGFAIAPGDTLAYASNYSGEVREFDLRTRTVLRILRAPGVLQEVVVSGDGKELYVGNENGFVEIFDLTSGRNVTRLGLGQVFGMALGPDGNTLFVARTLEGVIAAIDRTTRRTLFEYPIGGMPRRVKFNTTGDAILVANEAGWVDFLR